MFVVFIKNLFVVSSLQTRGLTKPSSREDEKAHTAQAAAKGKARQPRMRDSFPAGASLAKAWAFAGARRRLREMDSAWYKKEMD